MTATKNAKPARAKAAKLAPATEAPATDQAAPTAPTPAPTPALAAKATKPAKPSLDAQKITVLVQDPKLRGTRLARWPLVLASKTRGDLAKALKDNGFKNPVGGMLAFMVERGLVKLD